MQGKRNDFRWLALYVLFSEISASATCTFSKTNDVPAAYFMYQMIIDNEDTCILACYEEPYCTFVEYNGV
ncbi:hypothetical protein Y032_0444g1569 [Ancylostoma ceylanicum]|uniref:PAN-3 domain-containing protein n=1 Tax=Ancylostoma ceylanicum TaxID=53326 RepID=A0A016WZE5_9BILA|nr:hypothetical protein Y032_0444g1569 [Ancylostoma ceylanicum]